MATGPDPAKAQITQLLVASKGGDKTALDQLLPIVYDELRRLAASFLRRERGNHTLQATALVNEAYMRLIDQRTVSWENRAQFFALAAQMMRRILVNYGEARAAEKRGGGEQSITLDASHAVGEDPILEILAVDRALAKLTEFAPDQARIVELRFFAGLTTEEIAKVEGKSTATIERGWRTARAWLFRELKG